MSPPGPADYAARIEGDLLDNILPFWRGRPVDPAGGFFGLVANDLSVDPAAERGALLTSRILWTFSAAYGRYRHSEDLSVAEHAHADLVWRFHDPQHGGFRWSVPAGCGPRDRKQVYGQAFAIYALAEYHAATGLAQPLDLAVATFRLLERHARDPAFGGYLEAFGRDWKPIADMRLSTVDMNEPKSQNTHLHVMEAYARLLMVWPDPGLRESLRAIVEIMLSASSTPRRATSGCFFPRTGSPARTGSPTATTSRPRGSFARPPTRWATRPLQARIRPLAVRIAEVTLAEGVDSDGGLYNEGGPQGLTNTDKEWWPQAEAVVGFLNAHQISGEARFLNAALRSWDFIEARLIDRERGEWHRGVSRDGTLLDNQLKVSFWKCPYHNGRTGLEAVRRLREIADAPKDPTLK